jgi:hypothetical protein
MARASTPNHVKFGSLLRRIDSQAALYQPLSAFRGSQMSNHRRLRAANVRERFLNL